MEAVAVLAPWNDETCTWRRLGDGGAVLDSVLDALRASLCTMCRKSAERKKLLHKVFRDRHFAITSHTSTTSHQRFDPVAPFQASGWYVRYGACAHPSRRCPGRPGRRRQRPEVLTTAAFRLEDLWAVASRSPRLEICRSRTFICLHIRHTYYISYTHIIYIYMWIEKCMYMKNINIYVYVYVYIYIDIHFFC